MFSRNNLNRNGFFFHLLSENPTEKSTSQLFRGILYVVVSNLGLRRITINFVKKCEEIVTKRDVTMDALT